jgi:hypothetical protein
LPFLIAFFVWSFALFQPHGLAKHMKALKIFCVNNSSPFFTLHNHRERAFFCCATLCRFCVAQKSAYSELAAREENSILNAINQWRHAFEKT